MAYSKGTGLPMNPSVKTARQNPARVGTRSPIPSDGNAIKHKVPVARKPAKNKAAK